MNDRFEQIVCCSREIRERLGNIPAFCEGKVHFRPTASGVTLVSLLPDTPQLGKSGYRTEALLQNFDKEFTEYCLNAELCRPTPEKKLQSYLISWAYRHERRLDLFNADYYSNDEKGELIFVTDELPMYVEDGSKVVCDLLALRRGNGYAIPVQIELKSKRAKKRLIEQLESYSAFMNGNLVDYERIYSAILGEPIRFTHPVEKWMVWPSVKSTGEMETDRHEQELAEIGIGVVQYQESSCANGEPFCFHVGERPPSGSKT